LEERGKLALILFPFATMNAKDFCHAASISAKRLATQTIVSHAQKMQSRNADVEKTQESSHATQ
jgi:hypothetical protein